MLMLLSSSNEQGRRGLRDLAHLAAWISIFAILGMNAQHTSVRIFVTSLLISPVW